MAPPGGCRYGGPAEGEKGAPLALAFEILQRVPVRAAWFYLPRHAASATGVPHYVGTNGACNRRFSSSPSSRSAALELLSFARLELGVLAITLFINSKDRKRPAQPKISCDIHDVMLDIFIKVAL